jgi:predicted acetyltransferase
MPIRAKRISHKRDLARAVDLAARVFSTYYLGIEQWSDVLRLDPGYAPGQTFVVERGGEFISHVRVTLRQVRIGDQLGLLGGIGDVATNPKYRNRGYASACLQAAIGFMREAGCCLSSLGTGRLSFYRRLGWEIAMPEYRTQIGTDSAPAEAMRGYSRQRFRLDRDLDGVMRLHAAYNAGRMLSVARTKRYWRRQLAFNLKPQAGGPWGFTKEDPQGFIVITDRRGRIAAYARSRYTQERHELAEAAARDRASALALLAHLAQEYRARREIVLDEPPDGLIAEVALTDCGGSCTIARSGRMVRIIDLARLFELMAPLLSARLRQSELADDSGALRLNTELGAVILAWEHGEVSLLPGRRSRGAWRLDLPYRGLTQIVTGYRSAASVLEESGRIGELQPSQLRALETLFPRGYAHMNRPDWF